MHRKISPFPSLPKRGDSSLRKREGRRDFTNRCHYYFENINRKNESSFSEFSEGGNER
jgi:hypothetical protein